MIDSLYFKKRKSFKIKNTGKFHFLFGCFSLIILVQGCNHSTQPVRFSQQKTQELNLFLKSVPQNLPVPGLAVAVIKDDMIYYHAAGKSVIQPEKQLLATTPIFTGNLSEIMVATAIMKLVESGKIKLSDPVVKHLPYFKLGGGNYGGITIHNLLTQTSGVPHHNAMWDKPNYKNDALEITTRSIHLQQPLFSPPGSKVKRSPYNYDILADLISKVTHTSYEEYIQKEIFTPMGMDNSLFYTDSIADPHKPLPHKIADWLKYSVQKEELYPVNREHAGSMGLHASIKDIARWMFMLLQKGKSDQGNFLDDELADELLSPQYKIKNGSHIGLGWEIEQKGNTQVFFKTHQMAGFSADLRVIPSQHLAVVVLSNIAGDFNPQIVSSRIISWLNGKPLRPIKAPINIAMGRKLYETGSLDSAFNLYEVLQAEKPGEFDFSEEALSQLGVNLLYRLGRKDEALRVFEFAAQKYPASAYTHLNLAEAYLLRNDSIKANKAFAKVKKLPVKPELAERLIHIETSLKL